MNLIGVGVFLQYSLCLRFEFRQFESVFVFDCDNLKRKGENKIWKERRYLHIQGIVLDVLGYSRREGAVSFGYHNHGHVPVQSVDDFTGNRLVGSAGVVFYLDENSSR